MSIVSATVSSVAEQDLAVAWCSDLFGRESNLRPMEPSAEWQLTDISSVMVDADAAAAGGGNVIIGVADVDAIAAKLYGREIVLEPYKVPPGQFRLAELTDPAGNTIVFAQDLQ